MTWGFKLPDCVVYLPPLTLTPDISFPSYNEWIAAGPAQPYDIVRISSGRAFLASRSLDARHSVTSVQELVQRWFVGSAEWRIG